MNVNFCLPEVGRGNYTYTYIYHSLHVLRNYRKYTKCQKRGEKSAKCPKLKSVYLIYEYIYMYIYIDYWLRNAFALFKEFTSCASALIHTKGVVRPVHPVCLHADRKNRHVADNSTFIWYECTVRTHTHLVAVKRVAIDLEMG